MLNWYTRHGRKSLPWQSGRNQPRDPYTIWVAEIMLQQTRVQTVIPYYQKFMARFPDISALANCDADELLHYWSGLGYYARARNLQATAKQIVTQYAGNFPDQFEQVLALPGIGRSTAGAILAFAWGKRYPILDGNVRRVLARYYAIAGYPGNRFVTAKLWEIADQLTPMKRVGEYTQALMDLGANVCRRTKPLCVSCPLANSCTAYQLGTATAFPQPKPKVARRCKSVIMLLVKNHRAELLLVKRPPSGIWGGLWSLPEYTPVPPALRKNPAANPLTKTEDKEKLTAENQAIEKWCEHQFGYTIETGQALPRMRHSFTHFDLDILPLPAVCTRFSTRAMDSQPHLWYNPLFPAQIGLPAAVSRIVSNFK